MKRHLRVLACRAVVAVAFVLAGCGGGGSSPDSTPVPVGTYRGTVNLTVNVAGAQASQSGPIVLTVAPDQTVTVGSFPGSAPINHRSFTLPVPASTLNSSSLSCSGTIFNNGTFSGTTVNGTVSSSGMVCNGLSTVVSGNFTATLQAELPRGGADADLVGMFRDAVIRALGSR